MDEYTQRRKPPRQAMALLVVMVLTMLIALGAYRYSFTMQAQYRVTRIHEEQVQARLAALSGLELAANILEGSLAERDALGGVDSNPTLFQNVTVGGAQPQASTSTQQADLHVWHVSLVAPQTSAIEADNGPSTMSASVGDGDSSQSLSAIRFGLENESAKIHVPTLLKWERQYPGHARAALMRLPQAEAGPVDDWLRQQGVSSTGGMSGESQLMDRLQDRGSSSDLQSARDWFRLQWLGGDLNQNYQLDPLELALVESLRVEDSGGGKSGVNASSSTSPDNGTPVAWQSYLTWHSGERNECIAGQPRVYLNQDNLQELHRELLALWPAELANFVIAMRQYGPGQPLASVGSSSTAGSSTAGSSTAALSSSSSAQVSGAWSPDFGRPASYRLSSVLDLLNVQVSVPVDGADTAGAATATTSNGTSSGGSGTVKNRWLNSPFSSESTGSSNYNERLLDEATVELATSRVGRIDIRYASLQVLASVPGIDAQLAEQIVQQRHSSLSTAAASNTTIVWLLTAGLVDLERLKKLESYLTCRNDVYRTQSVGYRDALTPVYRCTAVIDGRQRPAQIIDHQIWHTWDRGFPVERFAPALQ